MTKKDKQSEVINVSEMTDQELTEHFAQSNRWASYSFGKYVVALAEEILRLRKQITEKHIRSE